MVVEPTALGALRHLRKRGSARFVVVDPAAGADGMADQVDQACAAMR